MIHYQLQCGAAHGFDAWFRDSAAYEDQAARGLLECPVCGERQVARALMAPAVPRKGARGRRREVDAPAPAADTPAAPPAVAVGGERIPDQVRAMLQRLRAEVERNCDYVGDDFAAEARRIHEGASQKRGIYGEATEAQAEALREDGIDVGRIPWLPRADS
jgi:hypothetical protein